MLKLIIYVVNTNYLELRRLAEQSVALAKATNKNVEQYKWYLEISSILQELRNKFEELEKLNQQNFEDKINVKQKIKIFLRK